MTLSELNGGSPTVLIAGAGPVGLLTALRLAQAGIQTTVIEKDNELNDTPRACAYFAAALVALHKAKVLRKIQEVGFESNGILWRAPLVDDGKGGKEPGAVIARFPFPVDNHSKHKFPSGTLYLRQSELAKLLYKEAVAAGVVVHFNQELAALSQTEDSVTATTIHPVTGARTTWTASFLVGTDGGKSTTRKLLDVPMKGHSWPERICAIDFLADSKVYDWDFPTYLVIDPVHFGLITPLENPEPGKRATLYRCTIALDPNDNRSHDEVTSKAGLYSLLDKMIPGERPLKAEPLRGSVYRTHQLCAQAFRKGRVLLAGDAAHLNTPFGAMGLTSGLIDSEAVTDVLEMVIKNGAPLDILDIYSTERQRAFQLFVDPITSQNQLRIRRTADTALDDWFLKSLVSSTPGSLERYGKGFIVTWRRDMAEAVKESFPHVDTHIQAA